MRIELDWSVLYTYRDLILEGLTGTLSLAATAVLLASLIGLLVGSGRAFLRPPVTWLFTAYVELVRNIPPVVQFFVWFFVAGLDVTPAAVVALTTFHGAYMAELLRSGLSAVPPTQWEASRSTGLSRLQAAVHVILPQALIRIIPLLSNQYVAILKDSSIAMTIGYGELTLQTQEIESQTFRGFEAATAVTVLYILLALCVVMAMHAVERWVRLDLRRV